MTSVMVTDATVKKVGPAAFKVCGPMFRLMGPMMQQEEATSPACMQTYFHDAEYQAQHRANRDASSTMTLKERGQCELRFSGSFTEFLKMYVTTVI